MRRTLLTIIAALAALALVTCGGDDDDSGDTTTTAGAGGETLTQAEFVAEAQTLCQSAQDKVIPLFAEAQKEIASNPASAEKAAEELVNQGFVPAGRELVDKISALEPPPETQAALDNFAAEANAAFKNLEQNPGQLFAPMEGALFPELSNATQELGLQSCFGG